MTFGPHGLDTETTLIGFQPNAPRAQVAWRLLTDAGYKVTQPDFVFGTYGVIINVHPSDRQQLDAAYRVILGERLAA